MTRLARSRPAGFRPHAEHVRQSCDATLARVRRRGATVVPISGTKCGKYPAENVAAAAVELTAADPATTDAAVPAAVGDRAAAAVLRLANH